MAAGAWDFDDAIAGATWTRTVTWHHPGPDDLTPGAPRDLSGALRAAFRLTKGDLAVDAMAVLGAELGTILLTLTDDQTFLLGAGRARYTVAVVFGADDVRPVLNGRFKIVASALLPVEV